MKLLILFCFTVILSSSCSIQRLAIGQLAPALSSASPKLQEERNWNLFKNATPGSLQLSEVLLEADPGNEDLLALLTKGYAAYGYVVNDTEHYAEKLADVDEPVHRVRAVQNLAKALDYGFRYLESRGVRYQELLLSQKKSQGLSYLDSQLSRDKTFDVETSFFTGTAWLVLANLRKDNMLIVSQVSTAFQLINWACKAQPDFQMGLCQTQEAVFHLARPKSLGGKPELAVKILKAAMEKYPQNLLLPVAYMEWYLLPFEKEKEYRLLKAGLKTKFQKLAKEHFVPGETLDQSYKMLNLFNAMAEKRFHAIVRNEGELF